jgi:hypothetical protein
MQQRSAYKAILGRLSRANGALIITRPYALVTTALDTVVMDNVVPEMLLTRRQSLDALVAGLDALVWAYRV